jgi:hypothetical protein
VDPPSPRRSDAHIRWTNVTYRFLLNVSIGFRKEEPMFDGFDPRDRDDDRWDDYGIYDRRWNDDPGDRDDDSREARPGA